MVLLVSLKPVKQYYIIGNVLRCNLANKHPQGGLRLQAAFIVLDLPALA